MKTYRIIMSTEYIVDANTEEEALTMVDYSNEVDTWWESIEELTGEE